MKGAHLWKRILNNGIVCRSPDVSREQLNTLQGRVVKATIIVDSRPRDERAEEGMPWRWDTYTKIVFPFNEFWVEGCTTEKMLWGSLVKVWNIKSEGTKYLGPAVPPVAAEHQVQLIMLGGGGDHPVGLFGMSNVFLDSNRNLIVDQLNASKMHVNVPAVLARLGTARIFQALGTNLDNVFDLLLLLSCKNVDLKPNDNDHKQVLRAIKRHGGNPGSYRYHTLVVRPAGSKPGTPGQDIGIMPRHICRGHFSEYGPEFNKGLLFGKYAGRFYIPPHMKGDKKNGIVEKDYVIQKVET